MTAAVASRDYDPLLDKSYRESKIGPQVVDFLAWLELARRRPRTLDQYERDLSVGCKLYPALPITGWTSEHMLHVLQQFTPASQRRASAPWKKFWKWAILWGHVEANPMDKLPSITAPPRKLIEVFTESEEDLLVSQPEKRDSTLMMVLLDSGIRKAEARNLRGEHVRLEEQRLLIRDGAKGGKHRVVPIAGRLVVALADLLITDGIDDEDHLWARVVSNQHGTRLLRRQPIGEGTFHRWWGACVTRAGVQYRKPHTTRHTFATKWLRDGGGIVELSKILGHASVKTTIDEYAHLVTEDIASELARILELREAR